MKTFSRFWQYLAKFFLEWEMFQIEVVEKMKTYIIFTNFFLENRAVYEINVEKCGGAREAAGDKMTARCMLD